MTKISKRIKALSEKVESEKLYALDDAIKLLKETATAKFDESVDVAVNLGINARKSDQNVRGSVAMPHGTGKTVRVAVFAEGELAEAAKAAGADIVGLDDLAEIVLKGEVEFDVAIATPETMRVVGRLGQVLGPKGLMPNPKVGTVTQDVAKAVQAAKAGQVQFRIDKAGIIHAAVGKVSFTEAAIKENLLALLDGLRKAKPAAAKGTFLKRIAVSSTMGPAIKVDRSSVDV